MFLISAAGVQSISPMSRVGIIGIGAALTGFVYIGATTTDTHVGALMTIVQSALETEMTFEWFDHHSYIGLNGPGLAGLPVAVAFLLLLFGGLPLAVFGLLLERQWRGVAAERQRHPRIPYAVLMFQIVSMAMSGFGLAMMGEALMWALSEGFDVRTSDWVLPAYFFAQILASMAVIPTWRRLMNRSGVGAASLLLNRA
jgi:hypothetical protein